jgi:hypothetical protein
MKCRYDSNTSFAPDPIVSLFVLVAKVLIPHSFVADSADLSVLLFITRLLSNFMM